MDNDCVTIKIGEHQILTLIITRGIDEVLKRIPDLRAILETKPYLPQGDTISIPRKIHECNGDIEKFDELIERLRVKIGQ